MNTTEATEPTGLFWIDLETTGLDPERDFILEMACFTTSFHEPYVRDEGSELRFMVDLPRLVAIPQDGDPTNPLDLHGVKTSEDFLPLCSPEAYAMHMETGLFSSWFESKRISLVDLEDALLAYALQWPDKGEGRMVIAGNTVRFDLDFLKKKLPRFAAKLSYRTFDVRTLALYAWSQGMPRGPKTPVAHRAVADIEASYTLLHEVTDFFMGRKEARFFRNNRVRQFVERLVLEEQRDPTNPINSAQIARLYRAATLLHDELDKLETGSSPP